MLRSFLRLALVAGVGMTAAACVDDGNPAPRGYYQGAQTGYANPYGNSGYYQQPAPYYGYANQQAAYNQQVAYNQQYGQQYARRYTNVAVTNRGQNGYRDEVVQQQVACGSQYYDGYRNRVAPQC